MKVKATLVADYDHAENPGDYFVSSPNEHEDGARRLSFLCPCGCCFLCGVNVRDDGQYTEGARGWNKNMDNPTVTPSININNGHWHGFLINGEFVSY